MSVTERSFGINLRIMRIFCLYPPEKPTRLFKVCSVLLYISLALPLPVLSIFYLIFEEDIPVERFGDNAFLAAQVTVCFFKFIPFIINGKRIKKCVNYFDSSPKFSMTNEQLKMIDKSIRISSRNFKMYLVLVCCGVLMTGVRPLFFKEYRFFVDVWLPFNATSELKMYYSVSLCMIICFSYAAFSCALVDPLIAGLACLASAHIEAISDNLEHLDKYTERKLNSIGHYSTDNTTLKAKIMYNQIRKCASEYSSILDFINEFEDCFSPVVFSQSAGGCLVLCFICFQLKLLNPLSYAFMQTLICLFAILIILYFYCYYGTKLSEKSDFLTNSIYLGNWYDYDITCKKALIILMEISQKRVTVTAGKLMELSLESFAAILKRSYSLLALLQNQ